MISSRDLQAVVDQVNGRFDALNADIKKLQTEVAELKAKPEPKAKK
tara:strand:- start:2247 stop:2384 length:138 start_codon:yes stop_codon:yes gene_type:complete